MIHIDDSHSSPPLVKIRKLARAVAVGDCVLVPQRDGSTHQLEVRGVGPSEYEDDGDTLHISFSEGEASSLDLFLQPDDLVTCVLENANDQTIS